MLSDKVWITRKARINCEERLSSNSKISQFLIIYYSIILVFLSLWNFTYGNTQNIDLLLIFGSIAILVISAYIYSQRFEERAINMRNCYINLDRIYHQMKQAEVNGNQGKIEQLFSEYSTALTNIENHSEYDFIYLRFSLRNNKDTSLDPFTFWDYVIFIYKYLIRKILIILLILVPFILVFIWFFVKEYVSI